MHFFAKKNTLAVIFVIGILSLTFIDAKPRVKRDGHNPPCIDFKRVAQHGNYVGNCLSTDQSGRYFCHVMKDGEKCPEGSVISGSFPDKCKEYDACQLANNVHPWGSAVIEDST